MINPPKKQTIIREFSLSLEENNKGLTAKGYIESNLSKTRHIVYVYEGYKNGEELIFDYCVEDEGGNYFLNPLDLGRDITLSDIINELDKLDVDEP